MHTIGDERPSGGSRARSQARSCSSPWVMCEKLMIWADVSQLDLLSIPDGLEVLE